MGHPARSAPATPAFSGTDMNTASPRTNSQTTSQASSYVRHASSYSELENESISPDDNPSPNMTSHYYYHSDGFITASTPEKSTAEVPPTYSSYWNQVMMWREWHFRRGQQLLAGYDVSTWRPSCLSLKNGGDPCHIQYTPGPSASATGVQSYSSDHTPFGGPQMDSQGQFSYNYPKIDEIRETCSLFAMLSYISPERLEGSLGGATLDIVRDGTGNILAHSVPKKMLILFCGRRAITKYIRTLEREDNENWTGLPVKQELRVPQECANVIGFEILIAWMKRACNMKYREDIMPISMPRNLFAAISLARVMRLLGLYPDMHKANLIIRRVHFMRPLSVDDVLSVWKGCPKDSTYTERLIIEIRKRLALQPEQRKMMFRGLEELEAYIEEVPQLYARVHGLRCDLQPRTSYQSKGMADPGENQGKDEKEAKSNGKAKKVTILRIRPSNEEGGTMADREKSDDHEEKVEQ